MKFFWRPGYCALQKETGTLFERVPVPEKDKTTYFRLLLTESNLSEILVPRAVTAAVIAIPMKAAIKAYSIAVAPDSSRAKR